MQALNNVEACQGRVSNLIGPNVLASSSPYDGVWEPFLPSLGVHVPPVEAVGIDASLVHAKALVDSLLVVRTEANMVQEKNPVQYFIEFEVDDSDMPYHLIKFVFQVCMDMESILDGDISNLQQLRQTSFNQLNRRPVAQVEAGSVLRLCCFQPPAASES